MGEGVWKWSMSEQGKRPKKKAARKTVRKAAKKGARKRAAKKVSGGGGLPVEMKGRHGWKGALAEFYGVSRPTLTKWLAAGVDVWNADAVRAFVENQAGGVPPSFEEGEADLAGKSLQDVRKEKVVEETKLLRLKFAIEEGRFVPREKVEEEGIALGAVSRALWTRLESDLPPMLEGQTVAQMQKTLRDYSRQALKQLSDLAGGLYERCVERE